jgi:ADP-heptose:LPS heptosyltransferase
MQPRATSLPASNIDAVPLVNVLASLPNSGNIPALLPRVGIFRVLVCRPTHSLGNTLLLTPLLREIEAIYPGAEIDIVSRTPVAPEIFGRFASVRRIFVLPSRLVHQFPRLVNILMRIRETRYDLVIDPSPRSRTGRALLALANGRYKLGFRRGRSRSLTHSMSMSAAVRHSGHLPVALLRSAVAAVPSVLFPLLDIGLSPAERDLGRVMLSRLLHSSGLEPGNGVIGIFANATGDKRLPERWWLTFLETLTARFPQHRIVEIVPAFGRSMLGSQYPTYYSSDVRRLATLLSALTMFIGADCGIMHLACAAGVPVTGIFLATNVEEWGPYGPRDRALDARGLAPAIVAAQIEVPRC